MEKLETNDPPEKYTVSACYGYQNDHWDFPVPMVCVVRVVVLLVRHEVFIYFRTHFGRPSMSAVARSPLKCSLVYGRV